MINNATLVQRIEDVKPTDIVPMELAWVKSALEIEAVFIFCEGVLDSVNPSKETVETALTLTGELAVSLAVYGYKDDALKYAERHGKIEQKYQHLLQPQ